MKIAAHNVFIAKENILFLEEWITYHHMIGVDCFYLYDNTGVQDYSAWDRRRGKKRGMIPGKINKYNYNFDQLIALTDQQVSEKLAEVQAKFAPNVVNYILWQPKCYGLIQYDQEQAHEDCRQTLVNTDVDWCASIDMDEFIVVHERYGNNIKQYLQSIPSDKECVVMQDLIFRTRFPQGEDPVSSVDSLVVEQTDCCAIAGKPSTKYIYRVDAAVKLSVHKVRTKTKKVMNHLSTKGHIHINHYKAGHAEKFKTTHNINQEIISKLKQRLSL